MKNLKSRFEKCTKGDFSILLDYIIQSRIVSGGDDIVKAIHLCKNMRLEYVCDECKQTLKDLFNVASNNIRQMGQDDKEKKVWTNIVSHLKSIE